MTRYTAVIVGIVLLIAPGSVFAQLGKMKDFVQREKIINQLPLQPDVERTYRHRQVLNPGDKSDTPLVTREWSTTHRLVDNEAYDGGFVFVTRVTAEDVQMDTSVRRAEVADTEAWLFNPPEDHLMVYTSVDNRIYRNKVRGLDWPADKDKIIRSYTDETRLNARPPWFILPPYSGQCLNPDGITAERCTLGLGPKRGSTPTWKLFLTGDKTRSADEGKVSVREFLVTFPGGQVIKRQFREGTGLVSEQTRAGWGGVMELVDVSEVEDDSRPDTGQQEQPGNQTNTLPDQPDVEQPATPNSPNQLPDDQQPPQQNEPNASSNADF